MYGGVPTFCRGDKRSGILDFSVPYPFLRKISCCQKCLPLFMLRTHARSASPSVHVYGREFNGYLRLGTLGTMCTTSDVVQDLSTSLVVGTHRAVCTHSHHIVRLSCMYGRLNDINGVCIQCIHTRRVSSCRQIVLNIVHCVSTFGYMAAFRLALLW